jgi:HEAT repeat protein
MRGILATLPALALLAACGPAASDIAKVVGSENPVQREDGAKIAQNFDDPAVVDALVKVLDDPSEQVRLNAIESLAELEAGDAAGPRLTRLLAEDASSSVKRAAADALGRLAVLDAAPQIVAYVQAFGPDDRAQLAGVWALGALGAKGLPAESRTAAMQALVTRRDATKDRYVRYNASAALRTFR